ncbi:putative sulfate exporter family transporter [Streptomyces sp. E5N91]|uniref:YeiH family protein n=1 Tax=Streptomyces sp. E5N91 TaxID=1851996 RepID=UPI001EE880B2|nr:putative sulfate exporter family transporter [Streptomyces sp. E5N91]
MPGLATAATGVLAATLLHSVLTAVPALTAAIVLGVLAGRLPVTRTVTEGPAAAGLAVCAKRLMRCGVVLLGLQLSITDVVSLGWAGAGMVLGVVLVTLVGTYWVGRRLKLPGDVPLLVASGYAICGASAVGAVSQAARSRDEEAAAAVALVTACGTLAMAVLPVLHLPLGLDDRQFGRWTGASVHDVGQVVATAQTAGPIGLREAVMVKLLRVTLLAPLVAGVTFATRRVRRQEPATAGALPPVLPLFVAGFLGTAVLRSTGTLPPAVLEAAAHCQHLLLAAALFAMGTAVNLRTLAGAPGRRMLALGLVSWAVVAGTSYVGVVLTSV